MLPELDAAVDMLGEFEFGELVTAVGGDLVVTVWVLVDTVGLVTALLVINFSAMLETAELEAAEELVEAVVLAGEVAVELARKERGQATPSPPCLLGPGTTGLADSVFST